MSYFSASKNYLKQGFRETITMDKPATLDSAFDAYQTSYVIVHNLGYRPLVKAWYEPDSDGVIFPVVGQRQDVPHLYDYGIVEFMFFIDEITDTTVTLRAEVFELEGALTGTFLAHYRIYLDPTV